MVYFLLCFRDVVSLNSFHAQFILVQVRNICVVHSLLAYTGKDLICFVSLSRYNDRSSFPLKFTTSWIHISIWPHLRIGKDRLKSLDCTMSMYQNRSWFLDCVVLIEAIDIFEASGGIVTVEFFVPFFYKFVMEDSYKACFKLQKVIGRGIASRRYLGYAQA